MKILIFNHYFDQDIEALAYANNNENEIRVLSCNEILNLANQVLPSEIRNDFKYNILDYKKEKANYRNIIFDYYKRIISFYDFNVCIIPSELFYWVRELINILKENNILVVVIDKEGMICPYDFKIISSEINNSCPFMSDYLFVWSKRQQTFWELSGIEKKRIKIIGIPRSDFWFNKKLWKKKEDLNLGLHSDHKMILFFTYLSWAYIPPSLYESNEISWKKLRSETENILFEFAYENPEVDVVIKMHPQQGGEIEYIPTIKKKINKYELQNIFLVGGAYLSNQLIINADIIVGFQTTALTEAMMTNKPIIYTFWGDPKLKWANEIINYHESGAVEVAESTKDLNEKIYLSLMYNNAPQELMVKRKDFIKKYFFNPNGETSKRTLIEIQKLLLS